jgi:hypothetical protein
VFEDELLIALDEAHGGMAIGRREPAASWAHAPHVGLNLAGGWRE